MLVYLQEPNHAVEARAAGKVWGNGADAYFAPRCHIDRAGT
jgi:hypothetical protein